MWSTQTPSSLLAEAKRNYRVLLSDVAADVAGDEAGGVAGGRALLVARGHWRDKFGPKAPPMPRGPKIASADLYEMRRSRMRQVALPPRASEHKLQALPRRSRVCNRSALSLFSAEPPPDPDPEP